MNIINDRGVVLNPEVIYDSTGLESGQPLAWMGTKLTIAKHQGNWFYGCSADFYSGPCSILGKPFASKEEAIEAACLLIEKKYQDFAQYSFGSLFKHIMKNKQAFDQWRLTRNQLKLW